MNRPLVFLLLTLITLIDSPPALPNYPLAGGVDDHNANNGPNQDEGAAGNQNGLEEGADNQNGPDEGVGPPETPEETTGNEGADKGVNSTEDGVATETKVSNETGVHEPEEGVANQPELFEEPNEPNKPNKSTFQSVVEQVEVPGETQNDGNLLANHVISPIEHEEDEEPLTERGSGRNRERNATTCWHQ